ncbi:NAD(P)/FAD-dependent oxidoreductase [Candidatus Zinderia endosymbiont of Aphrophora alni]|uniref:NAD(P)/FAD-dependent oxidoreductase n=1 Tax=Candidatus Zinderia endosymbiont of Aphrophora alni TaxID=3077951 RepID=UPI0030CD2A47
MNKNIIKTDALIIGAGPVGLFQIFELGLLEIKVHIIDSLKNIGGQCIELYPDKPIYDIPAVPVCTGKQLINNLLKQIEPFNPIFHLNQEVLNIKKRKDNFFNVETNIGTKFITKTIFIAAGVGSFKPRELKVSGINKFKNSQLFYNVKNINFFKKKNIIICGGGDSALDWTLNLLKIAKTVTLIHRRDNFRASPLSVSKMKSLCLEYKMQFLIGQIIGFNINKEKKLSEIKIISTDNVIRRVPLDMLLVFFGLSPKLGAISNWGLDINRKQIIIKNLETFETNIPGIFAIGDINIYPGKKKLILSGFHEAALAAFGSSIYIFPKKKIFMQYTTTSPKLHKILGIK